MMASHGIDYAVLSEADYDMDVPELSVKAYRSVFKDTGLFEQVFDRDGSKVYRAKSKWAYDRSK